MDTPTFKWQDAAVGKATAHMQHVEGSSPRLGKYHCPHVKVTDHSLVRARAPAWGSTTAVSYTHLTLPTILLV